MLKTPQRMRQNRPLFRPKKKNYISRLSFSPFILPSLPFSMQMQNLKGQRVFYAFKLIISFIERQKKMKRGKDRERQTEG